jgi:long-chain fatty acid transport protein
MPFCLRVSTIALRSRWEPYDWGSKLADGLRPELTLRAGIQYDKTPTDDRFRNTNLPDGDRIWFGVGATYSINTSLSIDGAANYAVFRGADVDLGRTFFAGTPAEGSVQITGRAQPSFSTLSVALRHRF